MRWIIHGAITTRAFVVLVVFVLGSSRVDETHWDPFFRFGGGGVIERLSAVFFAYFCFGNVTAVAKVA